MVSVGISVLSYTLIHRNRLAVRNDIRVNSDKDIEEAVAKIGTLFITPANCNANFFEKPSSGTLTEIRSCASGNCASATPTAVDEMKVFATNDANWKNSSVASGGTGLSERVRIVGITYSVQTPQAQTPKRAAVLNINVTFQQNLGKLPDPKNETSNITQRMLTREVTKSFQAFVKTHNYTAGTLVVNPTGQIYGCTKSPDTSTVY